MIKIDEDLRLQSVDLTTDICDMCSKESSPMILAEVADINGDKKRYMRQVYVCKDCVSKGDQTILKAIERMMQAKRIETKMSYEWLTGDKQILIEKFIEIENFEEEIGIRHPLLKKAHIMKEFALKGEAVFSEEDMINYFNYYGNNVEMVNMLRDIIASGTKSKFVKETYINARTAKLTKKQVASIARNKFAKEMFKEAGQIWEEVPIILAYIEFLGSTDEIHTKVKEIIKFLMEYEYYTEKQQAVIEIFARDYRDAIDYFKKSIMSEMQELNLH